MLEAQVLATDQTEDTGADRILVATPGFEPPARIADGSDADALQPWPERHLLGNVPRPQSQRPTLAGATAPPWAMAS